MFPGVGYCAVLIAFFVSFYYNVIIGWALYFLASSISIKLPWKDCNNTWNTDYCAIKCVNHTDSSELIKGPQLDSNTSMFFSTISCNETRSPAKEYFK